MFQRGYLKGDEINYHTDEGKDYHPTPRIYGVISLLELSVSSKMFLKIIP
jgi:hypothetical protein